MQHVLVTGGAGFIGSHLVEALVRAHYQVSVVDDLSSGRRGFVPAAARLHQVDVCSPQLRTLVARLKPTFVCHLAAQRSVAASERDAARDAHVNIVGTLNVVEAVRGLEVQKFLFVSTAAVYGRTPNVPTAEDAPLGPQSPYGMSKLMAEQYLGYYADRLGLPTVVVRPANVYGPRQSTNHEGGVVAQFARQVLAGETLTIEGKGDQTRDFVYVGDVAQGLMDALLRGRGVYNLGTAQELSIRELAVELGQVAGVVPRVTYAPPRPGELPRSALDARRAERELGWQPQVPLTEGLRLTLRWYKEHPKL